RRIDDSRGTPVLTQGFVGRRALQHEILRNVTAGERLIVLQGLCGSGKTALACHLMTRRLALSSDPAAALFLRVPHPDEAPDPILGLRQQVEEHGRVHSLPGWVAQIEKLRARDLAPVAGFAATLRSLKAAHPALVVYVDRLDALAAGPGAEGGPGAWRPGAEEWWRVLTGLAADDILIVASTRYAGADLPIRSHVAVPPLSPSDAFRMMAFFVELADLTPEERRRLVDWAEGYPQTVQLLDKALERQRNRQGFGYECNNLWQELVEPALSEVAEEIGRELRLNDLWAGLPEPAKAQARRIASAGRLLPVAEIDRLGGERDALIRCGLLVRHLQEVRSADKTFRWTELWGLPRLLRESMAREIEPG
ncbi:MAG TPA: hypothetical protein VEP28_08185, partial [Rubrobacter sp.]|nr:hypothetical protein [Rubrobacter sp.]